MIRRDPRVRRVGRRNLLFIVGVGSFVLFWYVIVSTRAANKLALEENEKTLSKLETKLVNKNRLLNQKTLEMEKLQGVIEEKDAELMQNKEAMLESQNKQEELKLKNKAMDQTLFKVCGNDSSILQPPDFMMIGGEKCGSTSIAHNLFLKHPSIIPPHECNPKSLKSLECHYFDNYYRDYDIEWYKAKFPREDGKISGGDKTPAYISGVPKIPAMVYAMNPKMKIIAAIRNPVERWYSSFKFYKQAKNSFLEHYDTPHDVIEEFRKSCDECVNCCGSFHNILFHFRQNFLSWMFARGIYVEQLRDWASIFGGKQMHIIKSEDYFQKPQDVYDGICHFLRIKPIEITDHNYGLTLVTDDEYPLLPEDRKFLEDFYRPFNRRLASYLGVNWDDWLYSPDDSDDNNNDNNSNNSDGNNNMDDFSSERISSEHLSSEQFSSEQQSFSKKSSEHLSSEQQSLSKESFDESSEESLSGESFSGESFSGESFSGESFSEESLSGESLSGESLSGE